MRRLFVWGMGVCAGVRYDLLHFEIYECIIAYNLGRAVPETILIEERRQYSFDRFCVIIMIVIIYQYYTSVSPSSHLELLFDIGLLHYRTPTSASLSKTLSADALRSWFIKKAMGTPDEKSNGDKVETGVSSTSLYPGQGKSQHISSIVVDNNYCFY